MQTIGITADEAEAVLVELSRAVPPEIEIGRPVVAFQEEDGAVQVVTTTGFWWREPGYTAARLLPLGDGRAEVCRWLDGVELMREIDEVH